MGYKVAVVGATGNVGREMLEILAERSFPADEVIALASRRSLGSEVSYGDRTLKCKALEHYDFSDVDICLMSAGSAVSKEWSPKIAAAGAVVIDNSSCWRYDADVPLVVPEVNADAVAGFRKKGIIANPNCSTAQLVVALKPLHDKARIKRVVVATYQSVSGAGKEAMDELFAQTKAVFTMDEVESKKFPKRMAFNVIPHIDVFLDDGFTKEEWKMVVETKKILDPKIKLVATCVRVPVFIGHSEAVNIEFEEPITADEAREILRNAPGCIVIDKREAGGYATPHEAAGEDATYISRIREDATVENGLVAVVRLRQSAQGRRAQRDPDRRVPDQPPAHLGEEEGGVGTLASRATGARRLFGPSGWRPGTQHENRRAQRVAILRFARLSRWVHASRARPTCARLQAPSRVTRDQSRSFRSLRSLHSTRDTRRQVASDPLENLGAARPRHATTRPDDGRGKSGGDGRGVDEAPGPDRVHPAVRGPRPRGLECDSRAANASRQIIRNCRTRATRAADEDAAEIPGSVDAQDFQQRPSLTLPNRG